MKPVNNKSLFHFVCDQMEKLDNNIITVDEAKGQAMLAKQANNSLKYEIDRAKIKIKVEEHNKEHDSNVEFREAEGKNFD